MKLVILNRDDIRNPLHPNMFDELLEQFGLPLYSEELHLYVKAAGNEWISYDPEEL